MSAAIRPNGSLTCAERLSAWADQYPTTIKTLKIAAFVLGVGIAVSFALLKAGFSSSVAVVGGLSILLGYGVLSVFNRTVAAPRPIDSTRAGWGGASLVPFFHDIDSSVTERVSSPTVIARREDFDPRQSAPPIIGKSEFVSRDMVAHLMRRKKDSALGVKYTPGDAITNMEGALHTFVTPVSKIVMTGDYRWVGQLQGRPFGDNRVRKVILSAAIHPDFEYDTVIMPLVKVRDRAIVGREMSLDREIPSSEAKRDPEVLARYEDELLKHMVYHLSPEHCLPALDAIRPDQIMDQPATKALLEQMIQNREPDDILQDKFMRIGETVVSLAMLYQIYVHQVRNEFTVLNERAPQGYVYTINPPSIFARGIGGAEILNRLQALAFRSLIPEGLFSNLHMLGFSDYADRAMVPLFQRIFPRVPVRSLDTLFDGSGKYIGPERRALVLHNNSDAFGQNIETEGPTSLDGVIGSFSNAACVLKRDRPDLVDFIQLAGPAEGEDLL